MNVLDALTCRKSVRSYNGTPITDDELKAILKAAQSSAIGMAAYDKMKLTVIKCPDLLKAINDNAAKFFGNPDATPLYGAPMLIVVSTILTGTPMDNSAYSNCATVVENMILEAVELDIGACHIWGSIAGLNTNPELVKALALPEGFTPCCGVILGKSDDKYVARDIPDDRMAVNYIGFDK